MLFLQQTTGLRVLRNSGARHVMGRYMKTSTGGVVRIVKPPMETESPSAPLRHAPLMNQPTSQAEKIERVGMDVRVAELFRQFQQDRTNKGVILNVLQGLSVMGLEPLVIAQFPGFHSLIEALCSVVATDPLTPQETVDMIECFHRLELHRPNGIGACAGLPDFDALTTTLSNQLVLVLDQLPMIKLLALVQVVSLDMNMELDSYFFWCLDKELSVWALNRSVDDATFIRDILGPLQQLTVAPLSSRSNFLATSVEFQEKLIRLIDEGKLSSALMMELVINFKSSRKDQLVPIVQRCVRNIIGESRELLELSVTDTQVLASALPANPVMRDSAVQSSLESILRIQLSNPTPTDSATISNLIDCVASIVVPGDSADELLSLAAPLVEENLSVLTTLSANSVARLYHVFASGSMTNSTNSYRYRAICDSMHGLAVGRMMSMNGDSLARLSLAFASGIASRGTSAFGALSASIRNRVKKFSPAEFVSAVYGLAYAGMLTKSTLIRGRVTSSGFVESVPVQDLPKLAWACATADLFTPLLWDRLFQRLDNDILQKPKILESLSSVDASVLYEVLVAARVVMNFDKKTESMVERRIADLTSSWSPVSPVSTIDYQALLTQLNFDATTTLPKGSAINRYPKMNFVDIPVFVPKYNLVLDVTADSAIHSASTKPNGSTMIKHNLWTKLGYNVIAICDAQLGSTDPVSTLGGIMKEFVAELDAAGSVERPAVQTTQHWESRREQEAAKKPYDWSARNDQVHPSRQRAPQRKWDSRAESSSRRPNPRSQ
jgi:hypothetical protein